MRHASVGGVIYLGIIPIELSDEFQHFVDSLLSQDVKDEMSNEEDHLRPLFFLTWTALRRVALRKRVMSWQKQVAESSVVPYNTHFQEVKSVAGPLM